MLDLEMQDDYEPLRKRILQRKLEEQMRDSESPVVDNILPILGGGIDLLSKQSAANLAPVATITGMPVQSSQTTDAEQRIRAIQNERATRNKQRALDDSGMLKAIEDMRQRKIAQRSTEQYRNQSLELMRQKALSDIELRGQALGQSAEKIAQQQQQFDDSLNAKIMMFQEGQEFKSGESEKDRASREKMTGMRESGKNLRIGSLKPPTADQSKAATYAKRMEQAEGIFNDLAGQGINFQGGKYQVQRALPEFMSGMKDPNLLLQEQAERNFINSILRRESGAAISPSEFSSAERQYFPRPGDNEQVRAQKKANREQAMVGMKAEAANAYANVPLISAPKIDAKAKGPKVGEIVKGYRFKGGNPADKASWEKAQ